MLVLNGWIQGDSIQNYCWGCDIKAEWENKTAKWVILKNQWAESRNEEKEGLATLEQSQLREVRGMPVGI